MGLGDQNSKGQRGTFSEDILYPTYEYAPRLFANFSATDDQLLAGVGMKLVGMGVAGGAFAVAFFRWYQAGHREEGGEQDDKEGPAVLA